MFLWILQALLGNPAVDFAHTQPFDARQAASDRMAEIHPFAFPLALANRNHEDAEVRYRCRDYLQRKSPQGHYVARVFTGMMSLPKDILDGGNMNAVPQIDLDQFDALCLICDYRGLFNPKKEELVYQHVGGIVWEMRTRIRDRERKAAVLGGIGVAHK